MKRIIVFGGTSGLGTKLVPLLKEKYDVVSLGSKDVDVTSISDVKNYFETIGDYDIVLNMFGKNYDTFLSKINTENYDHVQNVIDVNVIGNVNVLSCCLPNLIKKKWGRVISISSVVSEMNIPKTAIYSASKAFIDRLYSVANKENVRFGITCNTIQLGYWDGGMCEKLEPEFRENVRNTIGLKRWGRVDELYNTINYIVDTEYVSGINLRIDGGL